MAGSSKIWTYLDYEKDGKQVGWLQLPHSVTRSAYGTIAIPIAIIKRGKGKTAFLMAGNHGDEYEGQIALTRLIRTLDAGEVQGRVIIMPAANLPAAMDSARVSPIDGGNLNRSFPGDPDSGPTAAIAHYIDSVLFPMADIHHDLHSGGSSLQYLPFASMRLGQDQDLNKRSMAALKAFGPPIGMVWAYSPDSSLAAMAAIKRGLISLGGEFGSSGSVTRSGVAIVERGVRNLLAHVGIIDKKHVTAPPEPTRFVEVKNRDYYIYATEPGLYEPAVELGDTVEEGQLAGQIHFVDNPSREPIKCHFRTAGMVLCKRHFGRVERGDCVAHLATDWKG